MKSILLIVFFLFSQLSQAQNIQLEWAKKTTDSARVTFEIESKSINIDSSNNVYSIGSFYGTVDFDPGPSVFNLTSTTGSASDDIFIQKLDSNGIFLWAKKIGGTAHDYAYSIISDDSSNVYVSGSFASNSLDFDPGPAIFNVTKSATTRFDAFVLKLDMNGNLIWVKTFGGTNDDFAEHIALDNLGNIYIAGEFGAQVDFDPNSGVASQFATGLIESFILKLDVSGNYLWAKVTDGMHITTTKSLAVSESGKYVYTSGLFFDTVDFDPSNNNNSLTANGFFNEDGFILQLDSSGNFRWVRAISGPGTEEIIDIVADSEDNLYATGFFENTTNFTPSSTSISITSNGGSDYFIQKIDSNGTMQWVNTAGGSGFDGGYKLTIDDNNNLIVIGNFSGTADLDFSPTINNLSSNGPSDLFIQQIDPLGNLLWTQQINGSGGESSTLILDKNKQHLYLRGGFSDTIYANNSQYFVSNSASSPFLSSTFLFKYSLPNTTTSLSQARDQDKLTIYPNPTNGLITVENNSEFNYSELLEIYNLRSQLILQQTISNNKVQRINIESLENGIYIIKYNGISSKLIVNK